MVARRAQAQGMVRCSAGSAPARVQVCGTSARRARRAFCARTTSGSKPVDRTFNTSFSSPPSSAGDDESPRPQKSWFAHCIGEEGSVE